jgi:hypothetical protein
MLVAPRKEVCQMGKARKRPMLSVSIEEILSTTGLYVQATLVKAVIAHLAFVVLLFDFVTLHRQLLLAPVLPIMFRSPTS